MPARSQLLALSALALALACGPSSDPDEDAAVDSGPLPDTAEPVDTDPDNGETDADTDTGSDTAPPSVPLLHQAPHLDLSGRVLCWLPRGGPLDCWPIGVTFDTGGHQPPGDWTQSGHPLLTQPFFDADIEGLGFLVAIDRQGELTVHRPGDFGRRPHERDTAAEAYFAGAKYVWAKSSTTVVAALTTDGELKCFDRYYDYDTCFEPEGVPFSDVLEMNNTFGSLDPSGNLHMWLFIGPEEANIGPSYGPYREVSFARGCTITDANPTTDVLCVDVNTSKQTGIIVMIEPKEIEQPHGLDRGSSLYMGCVLDALDRVQCWGDTASPVGYRDLLEGVPADTGYDKVKILSEDLACAIRGDRVRCWGDLATPENLRRMPLLPPLP